MKPANDPTVDHKALVRQGYDLCAAAYAEARSEEVNPELTLLTNRLHEGAAVLDIGCGCGVPIARTLARQLGEAPEDGSLRDTALRFIVLSAARLATIGTGNPPTDQLARGRLLNAMLMLADLREKLDKTGATAR